MPASSLVLASLTAAWSCSWGISWHACYKDCFRSSFDKWLFEQVFVSRINHTEKTVFFYFSSDKRKVDLTAALTDVELLYWNVHKVSASKYFADVSIIIRKWLFLCWHLVDFLAGQHQFKHPSEMVLVQSSSHWAKANVAAVLPWHQPEAFSVLYILEAKTCSKGHLSIDDLMQSLQQHGMK